MKLKQAFIYLNLLTVLFFVACTKTENVEPSTISGRYEISMVDTKVQIKNSDLVSTQEDVSSQDIYFEFDGNGKYLSNGKLSILEQQFEKTDAYSGVYSINGDQLILTFAEPDLKVDIAIAFAIKSQTDQGMVLNLGKDQLVSSFEASVAKLDALTAALAKAYIDQMLVFDLNITLVKQ